ncbi:MAG TPA: MFS transporter [Candidatus Angelobacter sp.]|nr:MFS transporter [Candidatus Angelobacter sp.]
MKTDPAEPSTSTSVSARYKWWVVFMLWFVCFFNYADRQALSGVAPKLKEEFGFTNDDIGMIGSAFMWVYAGAAPLAGFIGDRIRRKDLILGGCLFWSLITVMTGWCGKLWQFVSVRALEGFGETFYFPASMSLVSDYHTPATRSRAMSFHQSSVYAGTILGSWLGAWFAVRLGWRSGFYFFGGAGVVVAFALFCFLREPRRGRAEALATAEPSPRVGVVLRDIFRTPTGVALMAVFAGANAVAAVFLFWTPTFLKEKFHFELSSAGLSGAVYIHLASAFSVPLAGVVADRLARRLAGGRMLAQAGGLLVGAGFIAAVGLTESVRTLIFAMICFGLCKGFYDAGIFASLYDVVHPRSRASAAGIMNTVGWVGGAAATKLAGWYADHGPRENPVANMSHFIAFGGLIYLLAAAVIFVIVICFAKRDVLGQRDRTIR